MKKRQLSKNRKGTKTKHKPKIKEQAKGKVYPLSHAISKEDTHTCGMGKAFWKVLKVEEVSPYPQRMFPYERRRVGWKGKPHVWLPSFPTTQMGKSLTLGYGNPKRLLSSIYILSLFSHC